MDYLLDTNILTAILKTNPKAIEKRRESNLKGDRLFISCITYFESEGGLLAVNATKKLAMLENLCNNDIQVVFLNEIEIVHIASRIYADLRRKGTPIQFPDILIAATAIYHQMILVSNDSDMLRVDGLTLENWLV